MGFYADVGATPTFIDCNPLMLRAVYETTIRSPLTDEVDLRLLIIKGIDVIYLASGPKVIWPGYGNLQGVGI